MPIAFIVFAACVGKPSTDGASQQSRNCDFGTGGDAVYVGVGEGCLAAESLGEGCAALWEQLELSDSEDVLPDFDEATCLGTTFEFVIEFFGFDTPGANVPAFRCGGDDGFDVIEFEFLSIDPGTTGYSEAAFFDTGGSLIAYRRTARTAFCCEDGYENHLWWGRAMPVTCEDRYDYLPSDFTTPTTP
jgi:hypothetical protein